jgi:hypothetical protein
MRQELSLPNPRLYWFTAPTTALLLATLVGALIGAVGCSSSGVNALSKDGGPGTGGTGSQFDGSTVGVSADAAGIGSAQCSDGIDNDGDGLIDYEDPECVGPLDNDESSFATGIPGDNVDACKQDCFFDGNSGMGDDGCDWQLKCDPRNNNVKCPYDASYVSKHMTECSTASSQSQSCVDHCQPLVPNGCDCFGCCVVPGVDTPIRLAATCTAADFNNPAKCPACTQVTQCSNPCERCEICVGKPTVPADCAADGGTPVPQCNGGIPCGPGTDTPADACPTNYGCVTGCCTALIIVGFVSH